MSAERFPELLKTRTSFKDSLPLNEGRIGPAKFANRGDMEGGLRRYQGSLFAFN